MSRALFSESWLGRCTGTCTPAGLGAVLGQPPECFLLLALLPAFSPLPCPSAAGVGCGEAEVEQEWLQAKGLCVLKEQGGSESGESPEGAWVRRSGKSVGARLPHCWCGGRRLECRPPPSPAPHFRPGHLAHTWLLLGKLLLAARVRVSRGASQGEACGNGFFEIPFSAWPGPWLRVWKGMLPFVLPLIFGVSLLLSPGLSLECSYRARRSPDSYYNSEQGTWDSPLLFRPGTCCVFIYFPALCI